MQIQRGHISRAMKVSAFQKSDILRTNK